MCLITQCCKETLRIKKQPHLPTCVEAVHQSKQRGHDGVVDLVLQGIITTVAMERLCDGRGKGGRERDTFPMHRKTAAHTLTHVTDLLRRAHRRETIYLIKEDDRRCMTRCLLKQQTQLALCFSHPVVVCVYV